MVQHRTHQEVIILNIKNNYNNLNWIMNKAIEMHLAGNVYCDIFATATNVHYDYTGTING